MVSRQKICVDTNILVDMILVRQRSAEVEAQLVGKTVCASGYALGTVYYLAKRRGGTTNSEYRKFTDTLTILPIDATVLQRAFELAGDNDMEDALQVAACLQAGVDTLVTADKQLARLYGDLLDIKLIG